MSLVLREVKVGYQLGDLQEKVDHLLFMDNMKLYGQNEKQINTLFNTVQIFSEYIGMEFVISKCVTRKIKRGFISKSEGIQFPNESIKNIEGGE